MKTGKVWVWHDSIDRATREALDAVYQLGITAKHVKEWHGRESQSRGGSISFMKHYHADAGSKTLQAPLVSSAGVFIAAAPRLAVGCVIKSHVFRHRAKKDPL